MNTLYDLDEQRRSDLAKQLLLVLNEWGIEPEHQIILLGLPDDTRPRTLNRYRTGTPFPEDESFLQRAHYILSIKNAVDSIYPHNEKAASYWVTTSNWFFNDKTPLEIMLAQGIEGMKQVIDHLNGTDQWS